VPGSCPRREVSVQWDDWALFHMAIPCGTLLVLTVVFHFIANPLYRRFRLRATISQRYLGDYGLQPQSPNFFVATCIVHMMSSTVNLVVWVHRTYLGHTTAISNIILLLAACIDSIAWLVLRTRGQFRPAELWNMNSVVDLLTIVPTFASHAVTGFDGSGQWLSLHFCSVYSLLNCYELIRSTSVFRYSAVLVQIAVKLALQLICVVTMMAGLVFIVEVLGDPSFLEDSYIETKAGDPVSFYQMMYFVIISITTVGYGDYSPRSMMARACMSVFCFLGVMLIYVIQLNFGQAWLKQREGAGRYRPRSADAPHVVAVLSINEPASKLSSLVAGFLQEILHGGHKGEVKHPWPDVVLLSPTFWNEGNHVGDRRTFEDYLINNGFDMEARSKIRFLVGNINSKPELERTYMGSSRMTFLLSDIESEDKEGDDTRTIFTAKRIQNLYPSIRLRVMLLSPDSKHLAVQTGLEVTRCFATRDIEASMLAQNVRCHGLISAVMAMLKSVDLKDQQDFNMKVDQRAKDAGVQSFLSGASTSVFIPPEEGLTGKAKAHSFHEGAFGVATEQVWNREQGEFEDSEPWFFSYFEGLQRNIYGFELNEEHSGLAFGQLAAAMYVESGAVLLGIHDEDRILLCPQTTHHVTLMMGQICFAVAENEAKLSPYSLGHNQGVGWRHNLIRLRDANAIRTRLEGPHESAARVVGHKIHHAMSRAELPDEDDAIWFDAHARRGSNRTERINKTSLQIAREMRFNLKTGEQLVMLVVCQGTIWEQVQTMIESLRAYYMPVKHPVIVLSPADAPSRMIEKFAGCAAFVTGSCLKIQSLADAGLFEASAIVVISGEVVKNKKLASDVNKDLHAILCAEELECWCGISPKEVFTTYELHDNWSVRQFPPLLNKTAKTIQRLLIESDILEEDEEETSEEDSAVTGKRMTVTAKRVPKAAPQVKVDGSNFQGEDNYDETILFHPRFAAGQVFTPELWGVMLGKMYYMPAVIELVESLVMPHLRGQQSFPWQLKIPEALVGEPISILWMALAVDGLEKSVAMTRTERMSVLSDGMSNVRSSFRAVLRGRRGHGSTDSQDSMEGLHIQPKEGPAVVLALYRARTDVGPESDNVINGSQRAHGTGSHYYAVLAPPPHTVLRESDWVLVLGSRRFGKKMHKLGLLRNGAGTQRHSKTDKTDKDADKVQSKLVEAIQLARQTSGDSPNVELNAAAVKSTPQPASSAKSEASPTPADDARPSSDAEFSDVLPHRVD